MPVFGAKLASWAFARLELAPSKFMKRSALSRAASNPFPHRAAGRPLIVAAGGAPHVVTMEDDLVEEEVATVLKVVVIARDEEEVVLKTPDDERTDEGVVDVGPGEADVDLDDELAVDDMSALR